MNPIKDGLKFYSKNIEYLLLFSFTILLPILLFHSYAMNYIYLTNWVMFDESTFADVLNGFFTLLLLIVAQIPFIKFVQSDVEGEEQRVRASYMSFLTRGFSLYLFGVIYCVLVLLGFTVFIIPGLIILVFLFLTPYISILDNQPARKSWKVAFRLAKENFFKLAGILALLSVLEMVIELIGLYGVSLITNNFGAVMFSQILLNMIIMPLITIVMTMFVMNWRERSTVHKGLPVNCRGI